ncbi:hypothetical protein PR048_026121 [Dryococelus australis]|uniref:Uncharacterized protein n=1 Tax=Dryococelus australis TaxID=614101 RepID=A0ABQ9GKG6_9NEOP|nr:hypothetical protein PR048_026121 [Dryococelus australis]
MRVKRGANGGAPECNSGEAVTERLTRSHPTKANRVQSPAGSPDFRMWESCRTMALVGESSRGSPVSLAFSLRRCFILTTIALIGSQYLAVKSRLFGALSVFHCEMNPIRQRTRINIIKAISGFSRIEGAATQLRRCTPCFPQNSSITGCMPISVIVNIYSAFNGRDVLQRSISEVLNGRLEAPPPDVTVSRDGDVEGVKLREAKPARLPSRRSEFNPRPGHSGFSQVGIVPGDAVGRRVFSVISRFSRPFIPALLHTLFNHPHRLLKTSLKPNTNSIYTREKAKSKYRNRIQLERAFQKQSSDTHKTPYDRVKRCRERKINIKACERVNVDVFTQNKRPCPQHSHTQFFGEEDVFEDLPQNRASRDDLYIPPSGFLLKALHDKVMSTLEICLTLGCTDNFPDPRSNDPGSEPGSSLILVPVTVRTAPGVCGNLGATRRALAALRGGEISAHELVFVEGGEGSEGERRGRDEPPGPRDLRAQPSACSVNTHRAFTERRVKASDYKSMSALRDESSRESGVWAIVRHQTKDDEREKQRLAPEATNGSNSATANISSVKSATGRLDYWTGCVSGRHFK